MSINATIESKDESDRCLKIWDQKQVKLGITERVIYQKARKLTFQQDCMCNGPT